MPACSLGNACEHVLSPTNVDCLGCDRGYHAFCIGLHRQAAACLDDCSGILHYVCNDCKGTTIIDLLRELRQTNSRMNDINSIATRHDSELATKIGQLTSTTDQLLTITNDVSTEKLDRAIDRGHMVKLIGTLNVKHTEVETALSASHQHLRKLNERLSTITDSINAFNSRLVLSPKFETSIESIIKDKLDQHVESLMRNLKTKIDNLVTESTEHIPSIVESLVNGIKSPLNNLRDEIDSLSANMSLEHSLHLNGSVMPRPMDTTQFPSIHDELANNIDDDRHRTDSGECVDDISSVVMNMARLWGDFEHDICATTNPAVRSDELQIIRQLPLNAKTNARIIIVIGNDSRRKKNKKKNAVKTSKRTQKDSKVADPSSTGSSDSTVPEVNKKKPQQEKIPTPPPVCVSQIEPVVTPVVEPPTDNPADVISNGDTNQTNEQRSHCWVYLSGFNNMISTEQVLNYARYALDCSDVEGHMLLPRGTNVWSRRRLSFKLKVPISVERKILDKSNWPSHIIVRKFFDDKDFFESRQNHHRPPITA